jgi:hypothetical protein
MFSRLKVVTLVGVLFLMRSTIAVEAECIANWRDVRDYLGPGPDVVFSGTVISGGSPDPETTFEIDRVWKGDLQRKTTMLVMPGLEDVQFRKGITYLVFARFLKMFRLEQVGFAPVILPLYEVSSCSPTRVLSDAQEFVERLGPANAPKP